jgi:hypothetical protein
MLGFIGGHPVAVSAPVCNHVAATCRHHQLDAAFNIELVEFQMRPERGSRRAGR